MTKVYFDCRIIDVINRQKGSVMLKKTKTRELVRSLLEKSSKPISAYEIFEELKSQEVTLSSIYRTLETFYNNNIVIKELSSDKVCKYSINKKEHQHFLECRECHTSTPLDFCPYHNVNKKIKSETDFTVDEHNLIIFGLCKDCTHKNTNKKK